MPAVVRFTDVFKKLRHLVGGRGPEDEQLADQRAGSVISIQHAAEQLVPVEIDRGVLGQFGAEHCPLPITAGGGAGRLVGFFGAEYIGDLLQSSLDALL